MNTYPQNKGYFNRQHIENHRPSHIKAYTDYMKRFGKNKANAIYGKPDNWISSQRQLGLNPSLNYRSSGGTRKKRYVKRRKTRRT